MYQSDAVLDCQQVQFYAQRQELRLKLQKWHAVYYYKQKLKRADPVYQKLTPEDTELPLELKGVASIAKTGSRGLRKTKTGFFTKTGGSQEKIS
jgi:hypothetical protein